MKISRNYKPSTTKGNRQLIYCEGSNDGVDVVFYKTLLGIQVRFFEFHPLGSSNLLVDFAKTNLIENGFCLVDRDFWSDNRIEKLEEKFPIKFLKVHEVENFLLNPRLLSKLPYLRQQVNVEEKLKKVIHNKRIRLLADFLQFKINEHLEQFPRISKLEDKELISENDLAELLLEKLDINYQNVKGKIKDIKDIYLPKWKLEFDALTINELAGKEIFKALKNKIFLNPPHNSDIAKDIAVLMNQEKLIPENLKKIFNLE